MHLSVLNNIDEIQHYKCHPPSNHECCKNKFGSGHRKLPKKAHMCGELWLRKMQFGLASLFKFAGCIANLQDNLVGGPTCGALTGGATPF